MERIDKREVMRHGVKNVNMERKFIRKQGTDIPDSELPKIYLFINGESSMGVMPIGIAEDGDCLSGYCSSSKDWAKHDIGFNSNWKHEKYFTKYPNGFQLIWLEIEEAQTDKGVNKAHKLNQMLAKRAEK